MKKYLLMVGLSLAGTGLFAGGEYHQFHMGPTMDIGWSPAKDYAGFGAGAESQRQFGIGAGIATRFHFSPGHLQFGVDAQVLKAIAKGADDGGADVDQTIIRGTLRTLYHFNSVTESGGYCWVGPTLSNVHTSLNGASTDSIRQNLLGGAVGIGRTWFGETSVSFLEINLHQIQSGKSGSKAGGMTIEINGGVTF